MPSKNGNLVRGDDCVTCFVGSDANSVNISHASIHNYFGVNNVTVLSSPRNGCARLAIIN